MEELRTLFEYNRWANLRILDAVQPLSDEELGKEMGTSFSSVAGTLVHLVGAEWVWLERWNGRSPEGFAGMELTSVAAVRRRWDGIWAAQHRFLDALGAEGMRRPVTYRNFAGDEYTQPLGELVRHVVNHASYHRGQVVTLLRQLGHEAPGTDLVLFYRLRAEGKA